MNSQGCLKYCLEHRANVVDDLSTAKQIVSWLVPSAKDAAYTQEEFDAISECEEAAKIIINKAKS